MKDTNGLKNSTRAEKRPPFYIDKREFLSLSGISILLSLSIYTNKGPMAFVSYTFISFFLLYIFYRDILRYKPSYIINEKNLLAIVTLLTTTLGLSRLSEYLFLAMAKGLNLSYREAHFFLIPLPSGAMLATLLFDFHTSIVFSFIVSLLSGLWLEEPFFSIYFFIGSLVASFSILNSKKRSSILKGGFLIGITNLTMALLYLFSKNLIFNPFSPTVAGFAFMSGFIISAFVFLLLPLFELLFNMTTDISLVEFLDVDHPLMKALMRDAPGTYHHSVIVANLVEAAAENIRVNKLLARVGAYYHDIGKVKMPHYFVENQTGENRHEHITPHMSSLVLISHTKDGVELARQYKLPEAIIDIIQQHHGDSLITFFYEKAKAVGETVEESDYKYPGPKPKTKEAALIMMADAVEAASRVLTEPSSARISALVEKIISRIIMEGQLDECDFTFKEIAQIKRSFIHTLTGIFHKRINYPGFRFDGNDSDKDNTQKEGKAPVHQKGTQETLKSS
jgi:putative nucleotidyltransferase with HDIG domain